MTEVQKKRAEKCNEKHTFLEFIRGSENAFGMESAEVEKMNMKDLEEYIDFLDYLWDK